MKKFKFNKVSIIVLSAIIIVSLVGLNAALAATAPALGAATNYSVLGATTVTNTGATTTVGEVGVSAGSSITGFLPGVAAGRNAIHLHRNDASAIAAQVDNLAAFGALDVGVAGACGDGVIGGNGSDGIVDGINYGGITYDLAAQNLVPGVYCANVFQLSGTLTLNNTDNPGGVWIFRAAAESAALTTSDGPNTAIVQFTNPDTSSACDVWWRVASSATLGTYTDFIGNILALTTITMDTGANLVGRAFAQTGAVTLDTNTITGCATPLVASNLTLNKIVVGGSALESDWTLTATGPTPLSGLGTSGSTDVVGNVSIGTYALSESTGPSRYDASTYSCTLNEGDAVVGDSIELASNDEAICTITNTYHAPSSGSSVIYGCKDPSATNYNYFSTSNPELCTYTSVVAVVTPTPVITSTPVAIVPKLPKTGFPPEEVNSSWYSVLFSSILNLFR